MRERKKPRISWVTKTKWILRMEKIKNAIKAAYQWLNIEGGILHLIIAYALMLTFAPIGFGWATIITWVILLSKEVYDLVKKTNNLEQVYNDIVRDAIGWGLAVIVIFIQMICK
jgi:hypothetical protein